MRHILVPLDGSNGGLMALKRATEIAAEHDALLHLVKRHELQEVSVRNADSMYLDLVDSYTLEAERSYLDSLSIRPERDDHVERAIIEGTAFFAYDTYARDNFVDLVILSAGSRIAETLLRTLYTLTLVVPRSGKQLLQQRAPSPHVLCAVSPTGSMRKLADAAESLRPSKHWKYIECRTTPPADTQRLDPATHILAQCDRCEAEMIVIASHWRPHRVRGGVSGICRAVVREAEVPVLVVPT